VRAFEAVIAKTGHPTEAELIKELQLAVDLFRPSFDEEKGHDMANNCRRLWPLIHKREIDPRKEIITPALAIRGIRSDIGIKIYGDDLETLRGLSDDVQKCWTESKAGAK